MYHVIRPRKILIAVFLLAGLIMTLSGIKPHRHKAVFSPSDNFCTLVIDPGHGGHDCGAVAGDGTLESTINLDISLKLQALAEFFGLNVVMTRRDDSARTDFQSYSEREELVHRVSIINSVPNAVLISVHQNCFPDPQPSGAQVLYAHNEMSERLGKLTHGMLVDMLNPANRRVAEPADKRLYMMANATCPAVLVECGFMSNTGDVEKLKNHQYQIKFAGVLLSSYIEFHTTKSVYT